MATASRRRSTALHALDVAVRTAAAAAGGYFAAHAFSAFMTVVLPLARPDRVATGTLLAFVVWTVVALYAFAARSAWRACWVPVASGAVLMGVALVFSEYAARP